MTKLEIINLANSRVGAMTAASVTESKASRAMNAQMKHSLKALLCAHPWDTLKQQITLTASTTVTPPYGYAYAYALPKDFCRLVEEEPTGSSYDIVAGYFYGDEPTFSLSYVAYPYSGDWSALSCTNWIELASDSAIFNSPVLPSGLYEVLGIHMAAKCSYQITGDHNDVKLLQELYSRELATIKTSVSQQKRDMFIEASEWEDVRG